MLAPIRGIDINYESQGRGEALLLVHGLGTNLGVWRYQAPALRDTHRLVLCDLRGFGASTVAAPPYSLAQWSDDLAALLVFLNVSAASVVGHSLGAAIALRFALDHPALCSGLILIGGYSELSPERLRIFEDRAPLVLAQGMTAVADQVVDAAIGAPFKQDHPELVAEYKDIVLRCDPVGYAAACRAQQTVTLTPELDLVPQPTLVVTGELDTVAPVEGALLMHDRIPNSRMEVIPDAAHVPLWEQPAELNAALLRFLQRPPEGQ